MLKSYGFADYYIPRSRGRDEDEIVWTLTVEGWRFNGFSWRSEMGKDALALLPWQQTAAASTPTNVGTAVANAYLGNVNQVTPDGSLTYSQSGTKPLV